MRSYANGKTKAWLVLLLAAASWFWAADAAASPIRRTWLFEQMSRLGPPTAADRTRYALSLDGATYQRDALSVLGSATLDFRIFELRVHGARRWFANPESEYAQKLSRERDSLGVEIARYHAISQRHYGRLALGGLKFFPDNTRWIYLGLATGILPRPDLPWDLRLGVNLYIGRIDRSWMVVGTSAEVLRELTAGLKAGFCFRWSYIMIGASDADPVTNELRDRYQPGHVLEHMGFSLAPELYYRFSMGDLRLAAPLRLYVDRDITQSEKGTGPTYYPSEFTIPSLDLSFTLSF